MSAHALSTCLLGLILVVAIPLGARAEAQSHSTVRLIAGEHADGAWPVGVEIALADGWKTYWRMPGESGVPPEFDWTGSSNLGTAEVSFPAPARFTDAGGETIGYKHRVVFPVRVMPKSEGEPVDLRLTLHYAVCKDICVPAKAEIVRSLTNLSAPARDTAALEAFEAQVPRAEVDGLRLDGVGLADDGGRPALLVRLSGATADETSDIFVEGFDRAYFLAPKPKRADDAIVYEVPIEGLKDPSELKGRTLTLTVVAGEARLVRQAKVE